MKEGTAEVTEKKTAGLQFVFNEEGFYIDAPGAELTSDQKKWRERFEKNRFLALYRLGVEEKLENASASAAFLQLVADSFFCALTNQPDLELMRGQTQVELTKELQQRIEQAIPFVLGVEHINKKWMKGVFKRLKEIFASEIAEYDDTVSMYLTEQSAPCPAGICVDRVSK